MSNSPLVEYTKISPNRSTRTSKITKITIHHLAGVSTPEAIGEWFSKTTTQASSNYSIGNDGRIGLHVEEKDRAWTSSSTANDNCAVTIEVSNSSTGGDWPISNKAMEALIRLCIDICKRNGIDGLVYTGDSTGNLTRHNMFAATACPGPYLQGKFPYIAEQVNSALQPAAPELQVPDKPSAWAEEACSWAVDAGIIQGYGDGTFGWRDNLTREQMAVMLYRFAETLRGDMK